MLRLAKKAFVATLTLAITLVIVDLVLHGAARLSPPIDRVTAFLSAKIPDARLGHRPNPRYPGHDENGFRNPAVPETAYAVALGDSHTYGSGVASEQAWPRVLADLSGREVYNMGLGGYGPVHSLLLWEEALAYRPELIIEAIYAGNDLHDAFSIVYHRGQLPELKTGDPGQQQLIGQTEQADPLARKVGKTYRRGRTKSALRMAIKGWLIEHSRVVGLLRRTQFELSRWQKAREPAPSAEEKWAEAQAFAAKHPEYARAFSSGSARTIFTPAYRLVALDNDDPRIREGGHIIREAVGRMHRLAADGGIRFIVLLIPTKELAFGELAQQMDAPAYQDLLRNERQFWQETKAFLEKNSIEYVDTLQPLRAELEAGKQPYRMSYDGHPNAHGQETIARALYSYLSDGKP